MVSDLFTTFPGKGDAMQKFLVSLGCFALAMILFLYRNKAAWEATQLFERVPPGPSPSARRVVLILVGILATVGVLVLLGVLPT